MNARTAAAADREVAVTLPAPILDRLLGEAEALGLAREWGIAAFVAALAEVTDPRRRPDPGRYDATWAALAAQGVLVA